MKNILIAVTVGLVFSAGNVLALSHSDVSLGGLPSDAFYDAVLGGGGAGGGNPTLSELNEIRLNDWNWVSGDDRPLGDPAFVQLAKYDDDGNDSGSALSGLEFSFTNVGIDSTSGEFTVNWTAGPVPSYFDFVFALKGSTSRAYYYFDGFGIGETPAPDGGVAGSFTVSFSNPGEQTPRLSNITLYGRGASNPIPEPATMLLFGAGLAGLAGVARKKRI